MVKTSGRSGTSSRSSRKTPTATKPGNGNSKPDYTRHILCTLLLRMPLVMLNVCSIATLLLALSLAAHVAQALPLPSTAAPCHDSSSTTCYHVVSHTSNGPSSSSSASSSSSSQLDLQQLPVAFTGVNDVLTRTPSLSDALLLAAAPRSMLPTALATDATVTLSSEIEANRTANANGTAANGTATADGADGGGGEQHESWLKKAITTVKGWFNRRSNGELTRYVAREAAGPGGGINEGGGGTLDEIIERVLNAFLDHIDEADGGLNLTTGTATTSTSTSTSTEIKQQHLQQQHWQRRAGQGFGQGERRESPWDRWKIDNKQDGPVPWGNWKLGGRDDTTAGFLSSMLLAQRDQVGETMQHDEVLGSRSSSTSSEGQHNAGAKADGNDDVGRLRFVSFVPHIPAGSGSAKA